MLIHNRYERKQNPNNEQWLHLQVNSNESNENDKCSYSPKQIARLDKLLTLASSSFENSTET